MYLQLIKKSLLMRKKRIIIAIMAVLMGASLSTALVNIYLNINDKVGKELRSYGANIVVNPKQGTLPVEINDMDLSSPENNAVIRESDLFKLKKIFWKYNITGFAPYLKAAVELNPGEKVMLTGTWFDKKLDIPGEKFQNFKTGIKSIAPWWKVRGQWVTDQPKDNGVIVGAAIAEKRQLKAGDNLEITYRGRKYPLQVRGILSTGGPEDNQIFANLSQVQKILNLPDRVSQIQVSALIKPDDKLARKYNTNPNSLSSADYVKWYCSPYIDVIAFQINEVFPEVQAKPIPQIAQAEGKFLDKVQLLILLITSIALIASSLGVMTTMTTNILERRKEIGMVKAIGAESSQVIKLFAGELSIIGFLGGGLGYMLGIALARLIGTSVFQTVITPNIQVLPVTMFISLFIVVAGSAAPIRKALNIDSAVVLRGD